ncbi:mitochondrial DNA replication protein [Aspergillus affinis]|uniref:mitochondrial DNA replication protein n=1 Tax=Aspergillus affinis TaxID=1070780 RepID=UPI0022FE5E3E|nr:mitochondrial DNA replication protein [Aspergillus affinis]KAI9046024.1 mitochondrial DNA replication protein [Aspergillus affinis]
MALHASPTAQPHDAQASDAQERRPIPFRYLAVGAFMNIFQVTSLGQPMEVLKTHVNDRSIFNFKIGCLTNLGSWGSVCILSRTNSVGMLFTWPPKYILPNLGRTPTKRIQAWLEASTKGAILVLTSSEIEYHARTKFSASPTMCGVLGGIGGGIAQSYLTMGMTTCMKTVEVTRSKLSVQGAKVPGAMETFFSTLREKGLRGVNKGVNAVALRQVTGWSSRIGISRFAEESIRSATEKREGEKLLFGEKILASTIGGALSCWNQPFEVLRVEMQSVKQDSSRPISPTMVSTFQHILRTSGVRGLFRGVVPRIGVAAWATICMVGFGDTLKEMIQKR